MLISGWIFVLAPFFIMSQINGIRLGFCFPGGLMQVPSFLLEQVVNSKVAKVVMGNQRGAQQ